MHFGARKQWSEQAHMRVSLTPKNQIRYGGRVDKAVATLYAVVQTLAVLHDRMQLSYFLESLKEDKSRLGSAVRFSETAVP